MRAHLVLTSAAAALLVSIGVSAQIKKEDTAIDRANPNAVSIAKGVGYLKVEVPKWKTEHPCYSCHNNGDATRALLVAGAKGYDLGTSLDDTLAFLKQPATWDQNKAPAGVDNKGLAATGARAMISPSQTRRPSFTLSARCEWPDFAPFVMRRRSARVVPRPQGWIVNSRPADNVALFGGVNPLSRPQH